jgi:hypothetical protein
MGSGYPAFRSDMSTPVAKAVVATASEAAQFPVAVLPMMGASVPIYLFADLFKVPVIGLPIVNFDNSQHAANENQRLYFFLDPTTDSAISAADLWLCEGITTVILCGMKTAISIPDEIFEQAERLAKSRGWSRSELYASAVSAFVNSERFSGVREKLDSVYGDCADDSAVEPLLADAQARSIAKEKW